LAAARFHGTLPPRTGFDARYPAGVMKPTDIALGLTVPVLWGFGFTIAKPAIAHFPPLFIMTMTYGVTALCLCRRIPAVKTPLLIMAGLSLFVATIQAGLLFYGLARLPASTAVLILQSSVPFSVLFAWLIAGEKPTVIRLIGMALSFAGIVIILGAPEEASSWEPAMLVLGGAAVWALGQVAARRYGRDDGTTLTAGIAIHALPQMLVASLLLEHGQWTSIVTASPRDWATFAAFSLLGFVLAYTIWYGLLRRYRVDQVMPFSLLMPVVGVIAGVLLLGEKLTVIELIGGAVVIAGLAVVIFTRGPVPVQAEAFD
jgi:O-acetylserine/cysteine efflux transporter